MARALNCEKPRVPTNARVADHAGPGQRAIITALSRRQARYWCVNAPHQIRQEASEHFRHSVE